MQTGAPWISNPTASSLPRAPPTTAPSPPSAVPTAVRGGWEDLVNLSSQRITGQAQQALTYEHLAKNSKLPPALDIGSDKGGVMQQLVDKALGFDRKKFNEIEEKLKTIADNKQLTAEERAEQSKPLNEQRDAMLQDAMDRLTGKKSSAKEETKNA